MVGVHKDYQGLKLSEKLVEYQEKIAIKEKLKYIIAEATGPGSQHLFSKLGYEKLVSIDYKKFVFKGQHPFNKISECETCDLVVKKL